MGGLTIFPRKGALGSEGAVAEQGEVVGAPDHPLGGEET
jgi:hypothetical protein